VATSLALAINYRTFEQKIHGVQMGNTSQWGDLIRESLPVGLGNLFYTASSRAPITLLPFLAGNYQTGIFSAAFRVSSVLANVSVAMFSAILPVMASFSGNRRKVRALLAKTSLCMAGSSAVLVLALFYFAADLVVFLFGEDYSSSGTILPTLAWSLPPIFIGMGFSSVILSQSELIRFFPWVRGITAGIAIVTSLTLISKMESYGAAVTTVISETVLAVLYVAASASFLLTNPDSPETQD
jgi:O-antigen/teichoic acid export membrane protein